MGYIGHLLGARKEHRELCQILENLGLLGYSTGYPGGGIVINKAGKTIQNIFGNFFFSPRQAIAIRSDGAAPNYSYYNQSHGPVGGVSCNQGNCCFQPNDTLYDW